MVEHTPTSRKFASHPPKTPAIALEYADQDVKCLCQLWPELRLHKSLQDVKVIVLPALNIPVTV
jgi:hypothetical protein